MIAYYVSTLTMSSSLSRAEYNRVRMILLSRKSIVKHHSVSRVRVILSWSPRRDPNSLTGRRQHWSGAGATRPPATINNMIKDLFYTSSTGIKWKVQNWYEDGTAKAVELSTIKATLFWIQTSLLWPAVHHQIVLAKILSHSYRHRARRRRTNVSH